MPIFSRSKLRRTTAAAFALMVVSAAMTLFASHGYTREMLLRPPSPNATNFSALATPTPTPIPTNVVVSGSTGVDTGYATLKDAFAAINSVTQTGNAIVITINLDTIETGPAVLNPETKGSVWSSLMIKPSGVRSISGAVSGPLIDLNGADNVTIDGLNANGDSLTISNTSASSINVTSTIRFINGATHNTVRNATILGSFNGGVTTAGGTIFFNTDAISGGGNDNNTISNNNIGPAGSNLPAKAIGCAGTNSSTSVVNSNNVVDNNNVYDYFNESGSSTGFYSGAGCNTNSVTNNRFYQTASRAWTGSSNFQHSPIWIDATSTNGAQAFTITGNQIGYSTNSQTGTYKITGGPSAAKFIGIYLNGLAAGSASTIGNNVIASINVSGGQSGIGTSFPFAAIAVTSGNAAINNNTIGVSSTPGSLSFSSNASDADANGIYISSVGSVSAGGNVIGGLTATNVGGNSTVSGIRADSSGTYSFSANAIANLSSNTGTVDGIQTFLTTGGSSTVTNNMIALGKSLTSGPQINGIHELAGTNSFHHNSVFIGGSPSTGASASFACYSTATSNTRVYRDNIFVNQRSNNGATGKNYAVQVKGSGPNPTGLTINNNYYFASGSGSAFGRYGATEIATLATWRTTVGQDGASFEGDPLFKDAANATTPDLHLSQLSPAVNAGVSVGVTSDFDGDVRPLYTLPDIGADESIDVTAPDTTITGGPAFMSNSNSAAFTFAGTDTGGSGMSGFECSLDNAVYAACTSGQSFSGLADGAHSISVRAKDGAGNVDPTPASLSWTVDTQAPETTINSKPADPSNSGSATFTFSSIKSAASVSYTYQCKLDGGSYSSCSPSGITYTDLADGSHTFQVRATDVAGNVETAPPSYTWVIDTAPPVITAYTPLISTASTADRPLNVTVSDDQAVGSVSLSYAVNGVAQSPIDCGLSGACVIPGQATGSTVTYYIHAADAAGNTSDSPTASVPNVYTVGAAVITSGTYSSISVFDGSTFEADVTVTDVLDLGGVVSTGVNTLHLGCDATVTNAGDSSYVIGNIQKSFCAAGPFSFPTGTAANGPAIAGGAAPGTIQPQPEYSPVLVNVTSVTGPSSLTVSTTDAYLPGIVTSSAVSRYWTLTEAGDITADLTFNYLDEDVHGDEIGYQAYKRENGTDSAMGGSVDTAGNTITVSNVSSFSDWGIGTALSPTSAPVSIGGRVVNANGQGVSGARIMVSGTGSGARLQTITNPFGYFTLKGLPSGETYVVTVSSKRYTFAQPSQVLTLNDNNDSLLFTADQ